MRLVPEGCDCGHGGPVAEVFGRAADAIVYGAASTTSHEILDAAYDFADRLGTRIFFIVMRRRGLHVIVEVAHPEQPADAALERQFIARLGVPATVEYVAANDVLDRSALYRGPKIYKPSVISDWRGAGRKPVTIMEALLEWPKYDRKTIWHLIRRQIRSARRRSRLVKQDRRDV